jgi:hypothetical protein
MIGFFQNVSAGSIGSYSPRMWAATGDEYCG